LQFWPYIAQRERARHFEEEIRNEEDEEGDGIAIADVEVKVGVHACGAGVGEVYAIEAGDAVESA
jgi:hypothetical protein